MTDTSLPQYNLYATTLTNPEISCANALTLTVADQNYFRFFPSSSVVFYYMKPWEWSSFGFIYQGPAAANKLIMRMILALAASDMHRRGLISDVASHEAARNHGRYHYELAVRDLREYLEHGTSNETGEGGASESEFEMIFCTMFLMISFEWHYGHSVKHLQLHLQGVRCLLKAHPEMFLLKDMTNRILTTGSNPKGGLSFMPAQFLLWILYMEIAGHHRGLEGSLYDTLLDSGNSSLHPDYLHQSARIWGRCLWGEEYPDNQILDDMENHRALELLHHAMIMRNKIWQLALGSSERSVTSTPETLFSELMTIRDAFSDVFITAKFTSSLSARRALYTIYFAVCTFDAQILYHRRLLYPTSHVRGTVHRQALASMLEMLYRQYSIDPILLQRMPWSIFMVMIETEDPIHRDWAEQRLREVRHVHEDYGFINILVDEFIDRQRARPGKMVNLFEILQRQYSMYNK
ncbi:hypothetical protein BGW36DRAFT_304717 [Talaromyces proteolyticus]|uniref:Zn(II)2Cys6 transcription factor n=1 Tax=Talaromyces proteolyticus TaxID=1131652 RepID=A0AAD4KH54_9EURO|nr:uncharacterized protein BGW36DRAFT_304717 [Talaromyces proteolyticus]KAH8691600.1 hypothetical protein BGW36DRAFT_304717 [Talaromyces proteolyticus]